MKRSISINASPGGISLLLAVAFALLVICSFSEADASESVSARLLASNLQNRVERCAALVASFRQINYWVMMEEADTANGSLILAPPHRFRLEYKRPAGHLVGCDGNYIWTYLPEDRQVLRASWRHTTGWGALFLKGLDAADDSLLTIITTPDGARVARLDLGAHPNWNLEALEVEIDIASGDPVSYSYEDEEGNRTRFDFLSVSYPETIDASDFEFFIPESYEMLDVD